MFAHSQLSVSIKDKHIKRNYSILECKTLKGERRLINGICCYILISGYCATSGVSASVSGHGIGCLAVRTHIYSDKHTSALEEIKNSPPNLSEGGSLCSPIMFHSTLVHLGSHVRDSNHTDSSVFYTEIGPKKIRNTEINQYRKVGVN